MPELPEEDDIQAMLDRARSAARRLVEELKQKLAEVEANPPQISPQQLAEGRHAMQKAIAAAERTLAALEAAAAIDQSPSN